MKKCNQCNKVKSSEEFYTQKRPRRNGKAHSYGLRYRCIPCDKRYSHERRKVAGFRQSREWKGEKARQGKGTKHAERSKVNSQRSRDEMSDMYIRSLITKKSKTLKPKDIPEKLIKMHRISLGLKRELRAIKESEREYQDILKRVRDLDETL